jgi:hypothetical protein
MKQTAVEWLVEQWPILESQIPERILEQAKEMEKEQIEEAYNVGYYMSKESSIMNCEEYYEETFKSE